ncbi:MAG: sodium-independent anion transporter [Denitrovibrio sp.]|nr:MAG: sodium-independent anion transporter [Denitrovibrio sp.]
MSKSFVPTLFSELKKGYSFKSFYNDAVSGAIVGVVALPLAIAFAIASGVNPAQGLYTAIIAGFIISFLGGSKFQIGGPTGAFIVVVADIVAKFGYSGLAMATFLAGIMLVIFGLFRFGTAIKFIPYPMTIGFTSGIALIIAVTQVKDFFGLTLTRSPEGFIDKIFLYTSSMDSLNIYSALIGLLSIFIIVLLPKVTRKLPGSIVAILASTILVSIFDLPVDTIGKLFGEIPSSLPMPSLPVIDLRLLPAILPSAITIALLGAIESLLSAVVADGMKGTKHNSNVELVAQGIANIASPVFGGIPATGAIARTATNIKSGAVSPVSGLMHAFTLLAILLFFAPYAKLIPMSCLAGILLVVAYHMSEWKVFVKLLKSPKPDIAVMIITFLLTVFIDLTVAIETGVVLSALLFMNRMASTTEVRHINKELDDDEIDDADLHGRIFPKGLEIFEVFGPFFFGATNHFKDTLSIVDYTPEVLILRLRHINMIDATALRALQDIIAKTQSDGTRLILSGVNDDLMEVLQKSGTTTLVGENNIYNHIEIALEVAERYLDIKKADS